MSDTRIFRITGTKVSTKYGNRTTTSNTLSARRNRFAMNQGWVKVWATNEDATEGWTEVTQEFKDRLG